MATSSDPGDLEKAIRVLKTKQQEYYVQWVKDAIETEQQRQRKLVKTVSHDECRRLEKQFEKERGKEKERLQQIQEDHQLILKAKIAEWKVRGVPTSALIAPESGTTTARSTRDTVVTSTMSPQQTALEPRKKETRKVTKATLERLATGKPLSTLVNSTTTMQELEFHKDLIRKHDHMRLYRGQSLESGPNLKTLSETDLLQHKMGLLSQLHNVVSLQERIIQDDQWTVRSSVSSWKSTGNGTTRHGNR
ncbi:hypothetical protein Poli38472_001324 [Pythium oligandrum]|uniref:Uncharacterized protein n=1 Tax=Pythium oligandrum TaxID=41045 RepID=A0A8K1CUF7_PYTOL|nr:hypothetical protein Poli38472_001324 [Pythium oligandrum]|eukprot:TMW69168.1 hypothetical protein Poli38472_001324 [Pythium oligandrum]